MTSGTLHGILRMSYLFSHSGNRTLKSYYNTTIKRKCVTLSNLELLILRFFLFQLLSKIDTCKSRIEKLKEVNTGKFLCLYLIKSMEVVEKTELLRRLSVYTLSKIHLDRYRSFRQILLIPSWDINLNPGQCMEFKMKIGFTYFPFMIVVFPETGFTIV